MKTLASLDEMQKYRFMETALKGFCKQRVNGKSNPLDYRILQREKAFYVFNNDFLKKYFSPEDITKFEFYNLEGKCILYQRVVYPVYDIMDNVVAFNAYASDVDDKYRLSNKSVWNRDRYFYARKEDYEEGFKRQYINIVDGTVDKLRLNSIGEPAFGLFGSHVSLEQAKILQQYKNIIVHRDNDYAGEKLSAQLRKIRGIRVRDILRDKGKDVDDFMALSKQNEHLLKNAIVKMVKSDFLFNDKVMGVEE